MDMIKQETGGTLSKLLWCIGGYIFMRKGIFLSSIVLIVMILNVGLAIAQNCGAGYFDYDGDPGSWIPLDDVRGYTTSVAYGHDGEYDNYLYAYVEVSENDEYRSGSSTKYDQSTAETGWVKLPGHDHGQVWHYGRIFCNTEGCDSEEAKLNVTNDI